jgi:vacuolar-type H+-ATPase subunit F/Vma7
MRVLCLGTADDARGFALAGAVARTPADRRALETTLGRALEERPPVGLVLVSAEVAALSPGAVRAFAERAGAPPLLVLP